MHTVAEPEPGILWAGTRGAGAFRLVDGTFRPVKVVGAPYDSHYANVICPSPDGSYWLGTAKGLYQFRDGRRVGGGEYDSVIGNDSVLAMIEDRRGGFWVGTSSGRVLHLSRDILRMTDINTHGHGNMSLAQARDGTLWIGTRGAGLWRFRSGVTERIRGGPSLDGDHVGALVIDADDTLWIGTGCSGLPAPEEREAGVLH